MIACFLKPTKMHPPFYISIGGEDGVHFQPDCLFGWALLFLDSEPEAMPATAKRLALDGAQKKCYDGVNPMGKWLLSLSPSPSAYPNQHFFCVVSRGGVCCGSPMYGIQVAPVFRALRVCPVFPPLIYELNLMVLRKKPRLFAVTAFYQDVRVHHPYPVLLFPDEVFFL